MFLCFAIGIQNLTTVIQSINCIQIQLCMSIYQWHVTCAWYIGVNLKLTVLLNDKYHIDVTSVLPIIFVPGVNLHLTKSSVIRIKEIFTETDKKVKDDDGILAVSTALESIIGSSPGASAWGKELYCYSETGTTSARRCGRVCHLPNVASCLKYKSS